MIKYVINMFRYFFSKKTKKIEEKIEEKEVLLVWNESEKLLSTFSDNGKYVFENFTGYINLYNDICKVENATFTYIVGNMKYLKGFRPIHGCGIRVNNISKFHGIICSGFLRCGYLLNSTIIDGKVYCEVSNNSTIKNGKLHCSDVSDNSTIENGELHCDEWKDGTVNGGFVKCEIWKNGTFNNGRLCCEKWINGVFMNGTFEEGEWHGGIWKDGKFLGESFVGDGTFEGIAKTF
ncbi:MAG: hypothetical protein E7044_08425 [Lentisphaerae bacterium]|nr:hypothetical protein [Lentisphaerota bacterium]